MKLNTRIENSPRKFDVSIKNLMQNEIALDHLTTKNDFNRIFVTAKVTQICKTTKVSHNCRFHWRYQVDTVGGRF